MSNRKSVISFVTAVLVLCGLATTSLAETSKISAIIPWQGQGQMFPVATNKLRFLGALEGIMYVETAEGAMNEALSSAARSCRTSMAAAKARRRAAAA